MEAHLLPCLANPFKEEGESFLLQLVQGGERGALPSPGHSVLLRPLVSDLGMNRSVGLGPPRAPGSPFSWSGPGQQKPRHP